MANDAQAAREKARTELSAFEAQAQAVRKAQDAERTRLYVAGLGRVPFCGRLTGRRGGDTGTS